MSLSGVRPASGPVLKVSVVVMSRFSPAVRFPVPVFCVLFSPGPNSVLVWIFDLVPLVIGRLLLSWPRLFFGACVHIYAHVLRVSLFCAASDDVRQGVQQKSCAVEMAERTGERDVLYVDLLLFVVGGIPRVTEQMRRAAFFCF